MVGNDIVDLAEAKHTSNWQRPRFLEKLFTQKEQQLIQNSEDAFCMVWRLWSMKEAAYKLYTQFNPSRFYNPKAFECSIQASNGNVKFQNFECLTKTNITFEYLLSEARLTSVDIISEIIQFKDKAPKNQSEKLRLALLEHLSETVQISNSELDFQKSEFGIPSVYHNFQKINISLSHHGSFGAYAIA